MTVRTVLWAALLSVLALPVGAGGGPVETGIAACTVDQPTGQSTVYASDPPGATDCGRTVQSWAPVHSMIACRAPTSFSECKIFLTEYAADGVTVDGTVFVDCGPLGPDESDQEAYFVAEWSIPALSFGSCFVRFQGETPPTWDNWDARCRGGQTMVCAHARA